MKTKKLFSTPLIILSCLILAGCEKDYTKIMQDALQKAFGKSFDDAYWFSYPVDNFGIGTTYMDKESKIDPSNLHLLLSCVGTNVDMTTNQQTKLNVSGFADIGQGGDISIQETNENAAMIDAILPAIAKLININLTADMTNHTIITLNTQRGHIRYLDLSKWVPYWRTNDDIVTKNAYLNGTAVTVTEDVVLESLNVDITVNDNSDVTLKLALTNASSAGILQGVLTNGLSLGGSFSDSGGGHFTFTNSSPLILCAYYGRIDTNLFSPGRMEIEMVSKNAFQPVQFLRAHSTPVKSK